MSPSTMGMARRTAPQTPSSAATARQIAAMPADIEDGFARSISAAATARLVRIQTRFAGRYPFDAEAGPLAFATAAPAHLADAAELQQAGLATRRCRAGPGAGHRRVRADMAVGAGPAAVGGVRTETAGRADRAAVVRRRTSAYRDMSDAGVGPVRRGRAAPVTGRTGLAFAALGLEATARAGRGAERQRHGLLAGGSQAAGVERRDLARRAALARGAGPAAAAPIGDVELFGRAFEGLGGTMLAGAGDVGPPGFHAGPRGGQQAVGPIKAGRAFPAGAAFFVPEAACAGRAAEQRGGPHQGPAGFDTGPRAGDRAVRVPVAGRTGSALAARDVERSPLGAARVDAGSAGAPAPPQIAALTAWTNHGASSIASRAETIRSIGNSLASRFVKAAGTRRKIGGCKALPPVWLRTGEPDAERDGGEAGEEDRRDRLGQEGDGQEGGGQRVDRHGDGDTGRARPLQRQNP